MSNDTEFRTSFILFNLFLKDSIPLMLLKSMGNVFHNNGPLHLIDVLPISLEHLGNSNDKLSLERVDFLLKWFKRASGAVCWKALCMILHTFLLYTYNLVCATWLSVESRHPECLWVTYE